MADKISQEIRSLNMAAIHSKNTKPELVVRHLLFSWGYRYRVCPKYIKGKPDLWLKKYNVAVFVHGCFWHWHKDCSNFHMPKSRVDYWKPKLEANVQRDKSVINELLQDGKRCLVIWECTIKKCLRDEVSLQLFRNNIEQFMKSSDLFSEL